MGRVARNGRVCVFSSAGSSFSCSVTVTAFQTRIGEVSAGWFRQLNVSNTPISQTEPPASATARTKGGGDLYREKGAASFRKAPLQKPSFSSGPGAGSSFLLRERMVMFFPLYMGHKMKYNVRYKILQHGPVSYTIITICYSPNHNSMGMNPRKKTINMCRYIYIYIYIYV